VPPRLLPFLILLVAGCAPAEREAPSGLRTVTDQLGREIAVPEVPLRVLSLAPSLTETLFAAGAGDRLVAVSQSDDYPPGIERLPRFGTFPLDFEAVVALRPDLVLATDQVNPPGDADRLAAAGIPTHFFRFERLADIPAALRTTGALMGTQATAESEADSLDARLDDFHRAASALERRPLTLLLIGDQTLYAFGGDSYTTEMISLAGGESATAGFTGQAVTLSDEWVLRTAPEVILMSSDQPYPAERLLELHPTWRHVPAIRDRRVHAVPADWVLRPGPRVVEGIEVMRRAIHPEAAP
jgi:iron complex transport system substrate-binding protein